MQHPILERALGQVRAERARDRTRRRGVAAVACAVLAGAVLAGGVHLGRHSVPGDRVLVATSADGVRMTATVTPADGWVRLRAQVDGIEAGERCRLLVTDARGLGHVAGGWVASRTGGHALTGAVAVDPGAPAAISVVTEDGRVLVTADVPAW
ncbi:hypothetical protein ACFYOT_41180 [Saccharothrix saharensis]|uniref:hypothetical protein n=1 Tax=Saccharothrix saharensis TaxID=571190 RepID=UPI0036C0F47B